MHTSSFQLGTAMWLIEDNFFILSSPSSLQGPWQKCFSTHSRKVRLEVVAKIPGYFRRRPTFHVKNQLAVKHLSKNYNSFKFHNQNLKLQVSFPYLNFVWGLNLPWGLICFFHWEYFLRQFVVFQGDLLLIFRFVQTTPIKSGSSLRVL